MRKISTIIALAALAGVAACSSEPAADPVGEGQGLDDTPNPEAPVSIIRPDVEQPDQPPETLEPLQLTVGFPEGGSELGEAAIAALETMLASDQVAEGGPITLRGHSDAGGSDAINARASQARADAVKAWLVEKGVAEDRIEVIAFGEQNPVEPNALSDGSPNEAGRAANRRVDIEVGVAKADDAKPSDEAETTG